jgi:hypothetical protein
MPVPLNSLLSNWAAVIALWALPYLTVLDILRLDGARSDTLQWSLLVIGVLGIGSVVYLAWKDTLDPAWRATHGLPPRVRPKALLPDRIPSRSPAQVRECSNS